MDLGPAPKSGGAVLLSVLPRQGLRQLSLPGRAGDGLDQALRLHVHGALPVHGAKLFFGPIYLLSVGLPSILWAGLPCFRRMRQAGKRSYYSVYPERSATRLGERFAKQVISDR